MAWFSVAPTPYLIGCGACERSERLIHHSDHGTQCLSVRYTERLADAGIERSVGSTGDAYANALAESVIGLYKMEVIHRRGQWKVSTRSSSPRWSGSHGTTRAACLSPSGYALADEYERAYYHRQLAAAEPAVLT